MNNVRINTTEKEKLAQSAFGLEGKIISMNENSIDSMINNEKINKFNNQVDQFNEAMNKRNEDTKEAQNSLQYDINKAEIKPLFDRVLIKPFAQNPFQRMEVKNGLIIDAGGYTPHQEINPLTGKYEEQKEFIITGCVVETGPDCQYLKESDVVYYRKDTVVPVPFFKQGLVSLSERQVICVVNEGLQERFDNVKNECNG